MRDLKSNERITWGRDAAVKFVQLRLHLVKDARTVLDVGCRDGRLREFLPSNLSYYGVDIMPGKAVTRVCNVEQGLPFSDSEFDIVVGLDVLEHVDRLHQVFAEFVRVARRQIVIQLPNQYHWTNRYDYLLARYPAKYAYRDTVILDRHRWVTSHEQNVAFANGMSQRYNLSVNIVPLTFGLRSFLPDKLLGFFSTNLGARSTLLIFEKRTDQATVTAGIGEANDSSR